MNSDSPSSGRAWFTREGPRRSGVHATSVTRLLLWAARWLPGAQARLPVLRSAVAPGAVCVNFAAAGAMYSVVMSILAGPTGWVHHVEPLARPPRWPTVVAALLRYRNISVHHMAVGEIPHRCAADSSCRTSAQAACRLSVVPDTPPPSAGTEPHSASAPMQTLDDMTRWLGLERVDFLMVKLDAGNTGKAGSRVLAGAFKLLLRDRPVLLVRIGGWPGLDRGSLVHGLTNTLGYRMYRWSAGDWRHTVAVTEDCCTYLFRAEPTRFLRE